MAGLSFAEIHRRRNVDKETVRRIVQKYYKTGSVAEKPRPGRPRILTPRDERHLEMIIERDPHQTLGEITKEMEDIVGTPISKHTILDGEMGRANCGDALQRETMSEDETDGEDQVKAFHPSWRSDELQRLINVVDGYAITGLKKKSNCN
ncbi:hypothetical protein CLU79DRAFT_832810 [Phycomyces nitens]|nr:hypothetical protein CLU79DRAFT_832810 [Phycomyces nitens]